MAVLEVRLSGSVDDNASPKQPIEGGLRAPNGSQSILLLVESRDDGAPKVERCWRVRSTWDGDAAADAIRQRESELDTLRRAVKSLWRCHEYADEYAAFLQGQYTEDEFLGVAERYIVDPGCDLSAQEIVAAAALLRDLLGTGLTSPEVATILDVDVHLVEKSLTSADFGNAGQLEMGKHADKEQGAGLD